ncbi:MAG: glycerophosphodiester phosphodiesterase [Solirubrobacterales bacterium]|jgi:glycerophosphoryl diester phosphodiesterase|nr:glycerophosphodiester phosphodiesterase [Solirubrobacterales bacterium]
MPPVRKLLLACTCAAVALPAATTTAQAANPWLAKRVLNIAHQGGEDEFPSNTLYAFDKAMGVGADMLELDIGVTKDGQIVVMHDTTVDRVTNGKGTVNSKTLKQIRALDGAYWFSASRDNAYRHDRKAASYRFRGVATGKRTPPRGYKAADFRVPTLKEVMAAHPTTPINIEIKGRTKAEKVEEYVKNAEVLASFLKTSRRRDLIVVSFKQQAVDRFHELAPKISVAPGIDGSAAFLLAGGSPGPGVVAFQLPVTYTLGGTLLNVTTKENVAKAHGAGYAWQTWLSDDEETPALWGSLLDMCVDGIMTAQPSRFEKTLRSHVIPASAGCP